MTEIKAYGGRSLVFTKLCYINNKLHAVLVSLNPRVFKSKNKIIISTISAKLSLNKLGDLIIYNYWICSCSN